MTYRLTNPDQCQVGMRIRFKSSITSDVWYYAYVREILENSIIVEQDYYEYDSGNPGWHSCGGYFPNSVGYYVYNSWFEQESRCIECLDDKARIKEPTGFAKFVRYRDTV